MVDLAISNLPADAVPAAADLIVIDQFLGGGTYKTSRSTLLQTAAAIGPLLKSGVYNAQYYGAIGDGTSHPLSGTFATLAAAQAVYPFATSLTQETDWAGIQSAINAAVANNGGTVFIPDTGHSYLHNSSFDLTGSYGRLAIVGAEGGSTIKNTSSTPIVAWNAAAGSFRTNSLLFKNLILTNTGSSASGNIVFKVVNQQGAIWRDCEIWGSYQAVVLTASYAPMFRDTYFNGQVAQAISATASDASWKGGNVTGCTFAGIGGTTSLPAIDVGPGNGVFFSANDFTTNYAHLRLAGVAGMSIQGDYYEASTAGSIIVTSTSGNSENITIQGCTFQGNGATTISNVSGFHFDHNYLYNQAWSFDSTAVGVTGLSDIGLGGTATLTAPAATTLGNALVTSGIKVAGSGVLLDTNSGNTRIQGPDNGGTEILIGPIASPNNYYRNDVHYFQDKGWAHNQLVVGNAGSGGYAQIQGTTVANLPTASFVPGAICFVTDATSTTVGATAVGGGSNKMFVKCNGTTWTLF